MEKMFSGKSNEKQAIRKRVWAEMLEAGISINPYGRIPPFVGQKEAADRLRELKEYERAKRIMVPPDQALYEVRVNVLRDQKELIMATPGIKDGFYKVDRTVPSALWFKAISSYGVRGYGQKLPTSYEAIGKVDLMVTGAVAVSKFDGARIGKGTGYFDLEYAILAEIGCVNKDTPIVTVADNVQLCDMLPSEPKDVSTDWIVTPTTIVKVSNPLERPTRVHWQGISAKWVRSMRPLLELKTKQCHKS